jgi:hypothetical protein
MEGTLHWWHYITDIANQNSIISQATTNLWGGLDSFHFRFFPVQAKHLSWGIKLAELRAVMYRLKEVMMIANWIRTTILTNWSTTYTCGSYAEICTLQSLFAETGQLSHLPACDMVLFKSIMIHIQRILFGLMTTMTITLMISLDLIGKLTMEIGQGKYHTRPRQNWLLTMCVS